MKKETISLQEFANQVKELADKDNYYVDGVISRYENINESFYTCWIREYGEYYGETPELALEKLKNAIDSKQIKDVII